MSIREKLIHLLGGRTDYEYSLLERNFAKQPRIEVTPYDIQTVCAEAMIMPFEKPPFEFIQHELTEKIAKKLLSDGYISFVSDENQDDMSTSTASHTVRAILKVCKVKQ